MKYLILDDEYIVREIILDECEDCPGTPASERYEANFLKQCIVISEDAAVEINMQYNPETGQFFRPIHFQGQQVYKIIAGEGLTLDVKFFDDFGNVYAPILEDTAKLTYRKENDTFVFDNIPAGEYQIVFSVETDGVTASGVVEITAEPAEEPKNPKTSAELDKLTTKVDALTQSNQMLEDCLVEMANVVYA